MEGPSTIDIVDTFGLVRSFCKTTHGLC